MRHSFTDLTFQLVIKIFDLQNVCFLVFKDLSEAGVLGKNSYDTCGGPKLLRVAEDSSNRLCTCDYDIVHDFAVLFVSFVPFYCDVELFSEHFFHRKTSFGRV